MVQCTGVVADVVVVVPWHGVAWSWSEGIRGIIRGWLVVDSMAIASQSVASQLAVPYQSCHVLVGQAEGRRKGEGREKANVKREGRKRLLD